MDTNLNQDNEALATACIKACAACCRKGKIFLPNSEYLSIRDWLAKNSPDDVDGFTSRSVAYEGFYLYDQETCCQFLDSMNLCRLHNHGVKPSECFWWPLHVYVGEEQQMEIRVSTSCCEAYKHIHPNHSHITSIKQAVAAHGKELFIRFRQEFPGSTQNPLIERF